MRNENVNERQNQQSCQNAVISSPNRINVYDGNGKLIGQDYQRENGEWMHKWMDGKTDSFERGSWRGRCEGDNSAKWIYKDCL